MGTAILAFVLWSGGVPKLGPDAYKGPSGWHETVRYPDYKVHWERESVNEAIAECRKHDWRGYVQWNSAFGRELDSCQFMERVATQY